jgi:hypothetical protein
VRSAKGDIEGGLQDYNKAIRLKPDDALAFYNRGLARSAKGDKLHPGEFLAGGGLDDTRGLVGAWHLSENSPPKRGHESRHSWAF